MMFWTVSFPKIVVDAIDLLFIGDLENLLIQRFGRLQVVAERLLDDHSAPVIIVLLHQSIGGELFNDGAEETRSGRHVIEEVLMG